MLDGKLEDSDSKLAEAISVVLAKDKELVELKGMMKQVEKQFYDMGFSDAKNSSSPAIFQARRMGFM